MILSVANSTLLVALGATAAYAVAAWSASKPRLESTALVLGWLLHAASAVIDVFSGEGGARLGFAPVLSLTVWLVILVYAVESRLVPLPAVRRMLAISGIAAVLLTLAFPGDARLTSANPWAPLHWVLGVGSYGLFGVAVLHATLLDSAERRMRNKLPGADAVLGMPLLRLERLTFRFVEAGFIVLTLAVLLGVATVTRWRWDHKTVFSLLGWVVFAALIAGRAWRGWRGRHATRWLYVGAGLLLLAYAGSRFVLEVLLGRHVG
ncbi:MAG: cytochrome c biogenesis protein CcsA [Burkholderiaceae bacterium]